MTDIELKEKVKSIMAKFGIELPAKKVEAPVKLEDVLLIDGTKLVVDKMEVGSVASFVGVDGIEAPAEGEYELADGTKIVCVAGSVTEIKPVEVAPVEPVESDMKQVLEALNKRLSDIESKQSATVTNLEAQLKETKKGLAIALSAVEKINDASVSVSLELQKPKALKLEDMGSLERFRYLKSLDK